MLYGSHFDCARMLIESRSHQLGEGLQCGAAMPTFHHPSRLVLGSLCYHAAMPIYDCSHQLGEGQRSGAEMPSNIRPPQLVRERPQIRHRNDTVCTPFPISFMEVNNSQQRCHPDTTSRGKGQQSFAEMPDIEHPSQPVHRGYSLVAERPISKRLAREGSTKACNQQCQSFTTLPTSLWANRSTQKCYAESAHQLGKDIICTLIKPLLFLPFLLIYGSHFDCAKMLIESRSHQIWAILVTPKGHNAFAQYNQRPLVFRRNAL